MDVKQLLSVLTAEEKAALVSGTDFMYTNPVPRLGIPSLRTSDATLLCKAGEVLPHPDGKTRVAQSLCCLIVLFA